MIMEIPKFNNTLGSIFAKYYLDTARALKGTNPNNKEEKYSKMYSIKKPAEAINYISSLYKDGYGLKVIGRHLDLSYSKIRVAFDRCDIKIRAGRNISTNKTKEFRKAKALCEDNPWKNWPEHSPQWGSKSRTGISGYYISKTGSKVWLRSTWEYIYAKWLDKNNIDWKFEDITYRLYDGKSYRPDFFIYENGKLSHIVEIKGYYDNRAYKAQMLKEETNLNVVMIDDISKYCEKSYGHELTKWKKYLNENKIN